MEVNDKKVATGTVTVLVVHGAYVTFSNSIGEKSRRNFALLVYPAPANIRYNCNGRLF